MTVKELIEILEKMDQEKQVWWINEDERFDHKLNKDCIEEFKNEVWFK